MIIRWIRNLWNRYQLWRNPPKVDYSAEVDWDALLASTLDAAGDPDPEKRAEIYDRVFRTTPLEVELRRAMRRE